MTDELNQIAYNEGSRAFYYNEANPVDNPYEGVSETLAHMWSEGWWDKFYEDL